jgi:hypothetical protein
MGVSLLPLFFPLFFPSEAEDAIGDRIAGFRCRRLKEGAT